MNSFLAITYAFMIAYCPVDCMGFNRNQEYYTNATHVQFDLGVDLFDMVHIYASEETFQVVYDTVMSWYPYTQGYTIGAEYHKTFNEKFTLVAGASHRCQHPVNGWDMQYSNFNSGRTEIYLKVSGKIEIF